MLDKLKNAISFILNKLNFLDYEQRLSLSNITVAIFVLIAAIRMLLGGSTINIGTFEWHIQVIDVSDTLPVLYSLFNYAHKRSIINQTTSTDGKEN